jgi:hypothetical protein
MIITQTKLKNKISIFFFLSLIFSLIFSVNFVFAAPYSVEKDKLGGIDSTGSELGYKDFGGPVKIQIAVIVGQIIGVILALVGIIFFILIWMGALDIVGANGNEELVKKGKGRIKDGFIGVLVVFAAYVFAKLIIILATGNGSVFKLN